MRQLRAFSFTDTIFKHLRTDNKSGNLNLKILSVHVHLKSGQVKRVGFGRSSLMAEGLLYHYLKMQK
jgi:hypothetical protein